MQRVSVGGTVSRHPATSGSPVAVGPTKTPAETETATSIAAVAPPTSTAALSKTTTAPTRAPITAIGGRPVIGDGAVHAVRVGGRDVDVLFPAGGGFGAWVDGLVRSGAFTAQDAELAQLRSSSTKPGAAPDRRPTVGIILSEPKMLLAGHKNTDTLIALVEAMGCRPVLIPPCADLVVAGGPLARHRAVAALAAGLDGLVGPGGADVDPSIYGESNTASLHTNPLRDRFEADFVRTALDCDLFAFGICRSHQLWNAAAGGSLIQDVQSEDVVSVSHKEGHHPVEIERKSMIYEEVRQRALRVNSLHHQAVDFAGWGFRVVGRVHDEHTGKSMIEATERWNGITTQFHPELMQDQQAHQSLFATLGRRAHLFAAVKSMATPSLRDVVSHMKSDARYQPSDIAWAQRELGRRLAY